MANNCFIQVDIDCPTAEDAARLAATLTQARDEADRRNEGFYAGSNRYIFEAGITSDTPDSVRIEAWVKWGYAEGEVAALLKFLKGIAPVSGMTLFYYEWGCLLYGEYVYDGATLRHSHLPPDDFPEPDDEWKVYVEKVEEAYAAKGVTADVPLE